MRRKSDSSISFIISCHFIIEDFSRFRKGPLILLDLVCHVSVHEVKMLFDSPLYHFKLLDFLYLLWYYCAIHVHVHLYVQYTAASSEGALVTYITSNTKKFGFYLKESYCDSSVTTIGWVCH